MKTAASTAPIPRGASNYDEFSMQQTLQFADCLKDLQSLKQQLYSAAEHFESSYQKHEQKQIVMTSLKDYALKAFINTVDHLGSMSYKVNCLLNEKSNELSTIDLPFSCFEQRIQACQKFINQGSLSQQSLFMKTPSHHPRYVFPVLEAANSTSIAKLRSSSDHYFAADPQGKSGEPPTSFVRRGQHPATYVPGPSVANEAFSFTKASPNKTSDKRATSPFRFQLARSGSFVNRSTSPNRPSSSTKKRFPSEPRRSASPSSRAERDRSNDLELYASKNRRMFKALLGMRKSKTGGSLYKKLDEN